MDLPTITLSDTFLRRTCYYSSAQLLITLLESTRTMAKSVEDRLFWYKILEERGYQLDNTKLSATTLASIYNRVNDNFGRNVFEESREIFKEPISCFLVGREYIWILTTNGRLYSRVLYDESDTTVDSSSKESRWILTTIDEKIRALRGLLVHDRVVAIGNDSVFLAEPLGGVIMPICDADAIDYYVEDHEKVMAIVDHTSVIGVSLQRYHNNRDYSHRDEYISYDVEEDDSADDIISVVLLKPIETLLQRLSETDLSSATISKGFSLGDRGRKVYDVSEEVLINDPSQTREESNIIYYQGGYDAEMVRDIVSEYDNSEYYGEGDAL